MKRTYGVLILAGGKGRRMGGANKALLQLQQQTFLSRLENALSDFDEKLISLQDASWLGDSPFLPVFDQVTDRGPMEGLRCSLSLCRSDALLVVACDMPLFSGKLAKAMLQAGEGFDAVICQDRAGRIHPLCGIYSKQCLPAIESMIARGNYKITDIMKAVPSLIFSLETSVFSDMLLSNINTPEALEALRQDKSLERGTPIDRITGGCCVTSSL
ncbi:MAG: molybdenum cofactor guanylyltransferase [Oscillospiraceae bacterium]|nr:molybdenum cofactor guanylyltransferase [Oscillospiraceae bacterium]